jgi:hypothetical protein
MSGDQYDERARAFLIKNFGHSVLTKPLAADYRAVAAQARASERETCARDVCMYCDRRALRYGPAAGPNPAGNYVHQLDETGRIVLCYASAIRSRHARISANAAKEE